MPRCDLAPGSTSFHYFKPYFNLGLLQNELALNCRPQA
jgi:hypothetical protein